MTGIWDSIEFASQLTTDKLAHEQRERREDTWIIIVQQI